MLTDEVRAECLEVWKVRATSNYSAMEVGIVGLECPETKGLHVQSENVLVEVLRGDGTVCEPGEVGRVVVTELHNFATPLIRYELGDLAEVGEPCSCGRTLPVLTRVVGRKTGQVILPDGRRFMPDVRGHLLTAVAPVEKYQFVQRTLDEVDVKLVLPQPLQSETEEAFLALFRQLFRHEFRFNLSVVDDIPRRASGKYDIFRCDVGRSHDSDADDRSTI